MSGDRFPEFFAASLSDAVNRQGLSFSLSELRSVEDPEKVPYLLKVTVTDWKATEGGDIACAFSATLKTPEGEKELGHYADTRWMPGVLIGNSNRAYYSMQSKGVKALARELAKAVPCATVAGVAGSAGAQASWH
jgi:hypothetical protein